MLFSTHANHMNHVRVNPTNGIGPNSINNFGKYHNALSMSLQILYKHCFQFLLGLTMVPRENKNNAYAKFWGQTKGIMVFSEVAN